MSKPFILTGLHGRTVKIKLAAGAKLPERGTDGAAGWDLFSNEAYRVVLESGERHAFSTGVHVKLPAGKYWKIESKSGYAYNHGVAAIGGVIDEDYRGEVKVILVNHGKLTIEFLPGQKLAQAILLDYNAPEFEIVDDLEETERGSGGFGSTGTGIVDAEEKGTQ